ncbi:hypothetical protein [Alkalibacillus aidingensis]|uniref:hypothetical protein n=1 Tax=Alkalibacillus aidingensis TaxID=2747607 RepID=UPI001660EC9A|nr:hypothetical protein [Alkalibacillus aidingensis]
MTELKALYTLTQQMIELFEQPEQKKREELINAFEDFVSKRDQLLKKIEGPYSDDEKHLGQELIKMDQNLRQLVDHYLKSFQQDFASFKKKQASNKKYINPYQNLYGKDGSFIDKKN